VINDTNEFNLYQSWAIKTLQPDSDTVYPAAKVGSEGGEYAQIVLKHIYHGKVLDREALIDEAGDVLWYLAVSLLQHDILLSDVVDYNLNKIKERHGNSYNAAHYVPNVGKEDK
jgi:phosphoribosyl-ATP pyrophosphohydrolase